MLEIKSEISKKLIHMYKTTWSLQYNSSVAEHVSPELIFICPVSLFIEHVEQECYPDSYEDSFIFSGNRYYISYLYTSAQYLEDLSADNPDTDLAFKLRTIQVQPKIHRCLVRLITPLMNRDRMIAKGAIVL
jgi:hypothetical protein